MSALTQKIGHQSPDPIFCQRWMILISAKSPVLPRDLDASRVQTKNTFNVETQASAFTPGFDVMDILNVLVMRMKIT